MSMLSTLKEADAQSILNPVRDEDISALSWNSQQNCDDCLATSFAQDSQGCDGCLSPQEVFNNNRRWNCSSLEENGITFEATVTQFYQGVSSGGFKRTFESSGHGDYDINFDFEKLCELKGFSLELGSEHRFGETVNRFTGSAVPVALLPNLPESEIDHLALTKVIFKQEFSDNIELFFGKIDTLEYDENAFAGGKGRERFFSSAFNYNPIATRTIPFSTLGAGVTLKADNGTSLSFLVLDTEDTATTVGISELFADGVVLVAELRVPTQFFGRDGEQMFGGSWSGKEFTSLDQEGRIEFPDIPIPPVDGSWSLLWNFDQFVWQDPCDPSRGWGLFGRAGISDGNPNAIKWSISFGVGGSSLLPNRQDDTFGVGWYYINLSDEFGPVVSAVLDDEQGVELFYRIAITERFYVTPDIQFVHPDQIGLDTAIVPGIRTQIEF